MPKPLSNDLRKRIIEAKLRGDTEEKIAAEKEVILLPDRKRCVDREGFCVYAKPTERGVAALR